MKLTPADVGREVKEYWDWAKQNKFPCIWALGFVVITAVWWLFL